MKRLLQLTFSLLVTLAFANYSVSAQAIKDDERPPNAKPGKCYAKCIVPATYETVTERVLVRPETKRIETVPPVYETISEKVMSQEGYTKKRIVPAVYETVTEKVVNKEAGYRLKTIPAVYETVTERIQVKEASTAWVKGKADRNCLSADPEDCRVWCLVEVPAEYRTVTKTVEKTAARTERVELPATYKTLTKRVVKTPEKVIEEQIPPVYKTVTKTVMKTPASQREVSIPAEYKTISKTVLKSSEKVGDWIEVLCGKNLTTQRIAQIQRALLDKGYNVGPAGVDNVFGVDTKAALIKFQKANNLPVGNLNFETLKALGVN